MSNLSPPSPTQVETGPLAELRSAIVEDLELLATLHQAEPTHEVIAALHETGFPHGLGLILDSTRAQQGVGLLDSAMAELGCEPDPAALDALAADYADIYLIHSLHASPYESVWLDEDHLERQAPMFQVRAWYRRYGLAVADWHRHPEDHLVFQLRFIAFLCERGDPRWHQEMAQFMENHLMRWLGDFAERVANRCSSSYFAGVALLTHGYCETLVRLLGELDVHSDPRPHPTTDPDSVSTRAPVDPLSVDSVGTSRPS